ncbi:metallophosphoesterase [Phyllobacterium phragmitis]|uniref:Metallophosphoesterase n=1 Tax=Phyllobacterium phragmitis TaxID=2670329 RepID=A0A2S9IZ56_9HYPH|nr:metallophosphoesterase [Phyllobacterium phragmitis]PRD45780.1 metallophosphoesterase [Phyllobacterium phragmitis]
MKYTGFAFLIGFAAILQSFTPIATAEAAVLKNVSEYAGQRCNTPPRGSGVFVGIFHGVKESPFISDNDARMPVDRFRCFTSMEECRGWLYTMQSKYDAGIPTTSCRRH